MAHELAAKELILRIDREGCQCAPTETGSMLRRSAAAPTASCAGLVAAEAIFGSVQAANGTPVAPTEIRACCENDPDACERPVTDGRGRYTII